MSRNEKGQFGNGNNEGNTFSTTNQPTGNGRKKKIYTILKDSGYSSDDARTAFGELAWYTENEIKEVKNKEDSPVIIKVVAAAYLKALKDGNYSFIKDIIEQFIGKSTQRNEIAVSKNNVEIDWSS